MSAMSAPARADSKTRLEMLRWMTLARRLGERIGHQASAGTKDTVSAGSRDGASAGTNDRADAGIQDRAGARTEDRASGSAMPAMGAIADGESATTWGVITGPGWGCEAVSVGACLHARGSDLVAPAPGDLGAFLIRGVPPGQIVAQYLGRRAGAATGRDTGGCLGDLALGLIAPVTEAASSVAMAAGAALAFRIAGRGQIVICLFGERAVSRGDWHEGINFAAVQKLPIVYVCASKAARAGAHAPLSAVERVSDRAVAYGIPGVTVDGSDILDVYEAAGDAVARARRGEGPSIIEGRMLQAGKPRDAPGWIGAVRNAQVSERTPADERDTIERFARELVRANHATAAAIAALDASIEREIDEALAWAARQPAPDPAECLAGVYADKEE